eukprot:scaffold70600_cov31-Phaeocystis_antarctica.AAC.2
MRKQGGLPSNGQAAHTSQTLAMRRRQLHEGKRALAFATSAPARWKQIQYMPLTGRAPVRVGAVVVDVGPERPAQGPPARRAQGAHLRQGAARPG